MLCPLCGLAATRVVETKVFPTYIRRRRRCFNEHSFTTYEHAAPPDQKDRRAALLEKVKELQHLPQVEIQQRLGMKRSLLRSLLRTLKGTVP